MSEAAPVTAAPHPSAPSHPAISLNPPATPNGASKVPDVTWSSQQYGHRLHLWVGMFLVIFLVSLYFVSKASEGLGMYPVRQAVAEVVGLQESPKTVNLPHILDDEPAPWHTSVVRYSLSWPQGLEYRDARRERMALLLPRVGSRFRVVLNGTQIHNVGWYHSEEDTVLAAWAPHLIQFPPDLLLPTPQQNRIEVEVKAQLLERSGLGVSMIGDELSLSSRHAQLTTWQVTGTWMMVWASVFMAIVAMVLQRSSGEKMFIYMVVLSLAHALRMWLSVQIQPNMSYDWYFFVHRLSFTWYLGFLYLFISEFSGMRMALARWCAMFLIAVGPFWIGWILYSDNYDYYRWWALLLAITGVLSIGSLTYQAWREGAPTEQGKTDLKLIIVVSAFTLATGIRDFLVVQLNFPGVADLRWTSLGSLALMIAFTWILVRRSNAYIHEVKNANDRMERALQRQAQELSSAHEELRTKERLHTMELERRRMMRDMHDGLGSQLVQTLNVINAERSPDKDVVAAMIEQALLELRLHLDSMEPMQGDLAVLMGTFRQRMSPVLKATGIKLIWNVTEVDKLAHLDSRRVLHLYRSLQEIVTNLVKHSQATRLSVTIEQDPDFVYVRLEDNGIGLPQGMLEDLPKPGPGRNGRGLVNLQARARGMGASLKIKSTTLGLTYTYSFAKEVGDWPNTTDTINDTNFMQL